LAATAEGAYSAPPDPLAGLRGPTSKGRGREEGREERGEGKGRRGGEGEKERRQGNASPLLQS